MDWRLDSGKVGVFVIIANVLSSYITPAELSAIIEHLKRYCIGINHGNDILYILRYLANIGHLAKFMEFIDQTFPTSRRKYIATVITRLGFADIFGVHQYEEHQEPYVVPRRPDLECLLCFDGLKEYAFMPCRHLFLCVACKPKYTDQRCPVCRQPYEKIVNIFETFH